MCNSNGGPLPVLPQRVVGIGGTAGMVHPSTGYMVARTLAAAPIVANSIVLYLGSDRSFSGSELSAKVWKDLWPIERRRQRVLLCLVWIFCLSLIYLPQEDFLMHFLIWNLIIGTDSCHLDCFYLNLYFLGFHCSPMLLILLG